MEPTITLSIEDYNKLVKSSKQESYNWDYILDKLENAYDREKKGLVSNSVFSEFGFKDMLKAVRDNFKEYQGNLPKVIEEWTKPISSKK